MRSTFPFKNVEHRNYAYHEHSVRILRSNSSYENVDCINKRYQRWQRLFIPNGGAGRSVHKCMLFAIMTVFHHN